MIQRDIVQGVLCLLVLALAGCGGGGSGRLVVLTYNVAGLPEGLSGSHPATNHPMISPKLNSYALALVQEDFAYHALLAAEAAHPHRSIPLTGHPGRLVNDGLNRFSTAEMTAHRRQAWTTCHGTADSGSDCLAAKGFSAAEHALADGKRLLVYNLHMDAGHGAADIAAKKAQYAQLQADLDARAAGRALVVAGDTNTKPARSAEEKAMLQGLKARAGLRDACEVLSCGDDRIDRVLYRGAGGVTLGAARWWLPAEFVDGQGKDLSDHLPVAVELAWETEP